MMFSMPGIVGVAMMCCTSYEVVKVGLRETRTREKNLSKLQNKARLRFTLHCNIAMIQEVFGRLQLFCCVATILVFGLTLGVSEEARAASSLAGNVAWIPAAQDADIDRAFAQARRERKPVLLYWGATWCPPCNQLKATLFNQQEFALLAQSFVAVQVDGDLPGAQKLGTRFQVRGYPTTLLLNGQGQEITRLPGEIEPEQALSILRLGLAGGRPIGQILADARAGQSLTRNEWKSLAFYAWETDEGRLAAVADRAPLLAELGRRLHASFPGEGDTLTRFWLKALAAGTETSKPIAVDSSLRDRVERVLADPALARQQMDVLTGGAALIVKAIAAEAGPDRRALLTRMDLALQRLQADPSLSRADRVSALVERVALVRLELGKDETQPRLPPALLADVRETAQRMDRETTDAYERQAVITAVGFLLAQAGLWDESDALLKANLARSHSPYYLMSQLGSNARKLGRSADALRWYREAYEASVGPATRLQWGAAYLSALVDLSPKEAQPIEELAARLIAQAGQDSSAFYERSGRSMQRVATKLRDWNQGGREAAVLNRLRAQLTPVCARLPPADEQRANCEAVAKLI
jgi:thioredoxin-related protein